MSDADTPKDTGEPTEVPVNPDDGGDKGNDPDALEGGFDDFLDDVLGPDESDSGDPGEPDPNNPTPDDPDNKDPEKDPDVDGDDIIPIDDVLADDPDPDPTPDPRDVQFAAMMTQNQKLMDMLAQQNAPKEEPIVPDPDIFEDESFNQMAEMLDLDDNGKKIFQAFMSKFADQTQKKSVNQMLETAPDMVGKVMDSKTQIETVKNKFYSDNAELSAVKPFVSQLARTVAEENPTFDTVKVLEETAKRAYEVLGITKKDKPNADPAKGGDPSNAGGDKKKKPAFAKNTSSTRKTPGKKTKLDGDLDAMLNSLE